MRPRHIHEGGREQRECEPVHTLWWCSPFLPRGQCDAPFGAAWLVQHTRHGQCDSTQRREAMLCGLLLRVCMQHRCVCAVPCCHWTHSLLTTSSWYVYTPAAMAWKRRVRPASSLPHQHPRAASRAHPVPTPAAGPQSVMLTSAPLSLSLAAAALSYCSVSPSAASCGLGGDIVGS